MKYLMEADSIIEFWFEEIEPKFWWIKSTDFDLRLEDNFSTVHQQAMKLFSEPGSSF